MKKECGIKLRDEVKKFAQAMEIILRRNDDKEGWSGESLDYLIESLKDEVKELEDAARGYELLSNQNLTEGTEAEILLYVQRECCDVANFAMMISDNLKCPIPDEGAYEEDEEGEEETDIVKKCPTCGERLVDKYVYAPVDGSSLRCEKCKDKKTVDSRDNEKPINMERFETDSISFVDRCIFCGSKHVDKPFTREDGTVCCHPLGGGSLRGAIHHVDIPDPPKSPDVEYIKETEIPKEPKPMENGFEEVKLDLRRHDIFEQDVPVPPKPPRNRVY